MAKPSLSMIPFLALCVFQIGVARAELDQWSTVDPMTGRVETGSRATRPDGSQSYLWSGPYGRESASGYVSPPGLDGSRAYQSTAPDGSLGLIQPTPSTDRTPEPFFPTRPEPRGNVLPGFSRGGSR